MTPRGTWKFLRARPGRPANKCMYTPYIIWHFIYSHNKAGCIKGLYCPPGGSGSGQKWATASSYVRPPVGLPPAQFIIRRIPPPLFALSRAELFASVRTARTRRAPARARPSQGLFRETSRNISRLFLLQNCSAVNLSEMICKLTVFCYAGKVKPTSSYL